MNQKLKLLFLCTGNSCRSQMAEGWTRHLKSDQIEAYSAGIETHGLNPHMVTVMAEAGVDVTSQKSENIRDFADTQLDVVVTVCGHAHETCPYFQPIARWSMWVSQILPRWRRNLQRVELLRKNSWNATARYGTKFGHLWKPFRVLWTTIKREALKYE